MEILILLCGTFLGWILCLLYKEKKSKKSNDGGEE